MMLTFHSQSLQVEQCSQFFKTVRSLAEQEKEDIPDIYSKLITNTDDKKLENDDNLLDNWRPPHFQMLHVDFTLPQSYEQNVRRGLLSYFQQSTGTMRDIRYREMVLYQGSELRSAQKRMSTFVHWDSSKYIAPFPLATAGFVNSNKEEAICVYCRKTVSGDILKMKWMNPMELHRRVSMNCPFVLGMDVNDKPFPKSALSQTPTELNFQGLPDPIPLPYQEKSSNHFVVHRNFIDENTRLLSFFNSPNGAFIKLASNLSAAGLFLSKYGKLVCFCCGYETSEVSNENDAVHIPDCRYWKKYLELNNSPSPNEKEIMHLELKHPGACKKVNPGRLNSDLLKIGVYKKLYDSIDEEDKKRLVLCMRINLFGCANAYDENLSDQLATERLQRALQYYTEEEELLQVLNRSEDVSVESTHSNEEVMVPEMNDEEDNLCRVCYTNNINTVLNPCRHFVCCSYCVSKLNTCPVCREPISNKLTLSFDGPPIIEND